MGNAQGDRQDLPHRTLPPPPLAQGEGAAHGAGLILGSVGGGKRKSKGGFLRKTSRKLLEKLRRPVAGKQKRKPKKKSKALSKVKKMIEEQGDIRALVDSDDIHCLMIGASGVGKTAFFLYPNLEYACACGMSFLVLDTKGDLARNYGAIAPGTTATGFPSSTCVTRPARTASTS